MTSGLSGFLKGMSSKILITPMMTIATGDIKSEKNENSKNSGINDLVLLTPASTLPISKVVTEAVNRTVLPTIGASMTPGITKSLVMPSFTPTEVPTKVISSMTAIVTETARSMRSEPVIGITQVVKVEVKQVTVIVDREVTRVVYLPMPTLTESPVPSMTPTITMVPAWWDKRDQLFLPFLARGG